MVIFLKNGGFTAMSWGVSKSAFPRLSRPGDMRIQRHWPRCRFLMLCFLVVLDVCFDGFDGVLFCDGFSCFLFDGFWRKCLISLMVEVNFLDGLRRFRQQRSITKSTDRTWDRNSAGLTTYHRGSDCKLDGIWQELGTFPDVHLFRQQLQLMDTAAPVEMVVSNCQAHLCTVSGAVCGETSSLN